MRGSLTALGESFSVTPRRLTGLIVAGWDETDGGVVYEIPLGGACVKQPFAIGAHFCGICAVTP